MLKYMHIVLAYNLLFRFCSAASSCRLTENCYYRFFSHCSELTSECQQSGWSSANVISCTLNSLPSEIQYLTNTNNFKRKLKTFMFEFSFTTYSDGFLPLITRAGNGSMGRGSVGQIGHFLNVSHGSWVSVR